MKYSYHAEKTYSGVTQHVLCDRAESHAAKVAIEFITKWGMVAAVEDGEDSAGRQKLRLATPEELVDRAVITAKLLYERLEAEGELIDTSAGLDLLDIYLKEKQEND